MTADVGRGEHYRNWMYSPIMVAFLVIIAYIVVALLTGSNIIRSILGLAAIFAMGYCALSLIRGATLRLTIGEKIAMSTGLAILLTTISALLSSAVGIPISDLSILLLAPYFAVLAILNAARTKDSGVQITETFRYIVDFSEYQSGERKIIMALLAAISIALAALLCISLVTVPDTYSAGIAITGADGTPASLPTTASKGTTATFNLTVFGGSPGGELTIRMRLTLANSSGGVVYHHVAWAYPLVLNASTETNKTMMVDAGAAITETASFIINEVGVYVMSLDLLSSGNIVASSHFQLEVTG